MDHHAVAPLIRYPPSNNSLLSSGNPKKAPAYEPRTEAISPVLNDDIISTKDEQALLVEKLKKVEAEILQADLQISRLRKQKAQLEQENSASKEDGDQENVCDTKQLSIAKLVYHENRAKAQKAHAKFISKELPLYNQPSDNSVYHHNASKFGDFKSLLIACISKRFQTRLKLEESVSAEYDRRMEKWLKSIEAEDSQPNKRINDAKTREFFEKQFPELKKARESVERFSRVGQRVARSDAELDEIMDGINEREDLDKKVKSYAVIPPMLEEMRSRKPKFINMNGYVEDIIAEYKEYQILNTWTDEEKEIFRESYLQNPKNFGLIASMTSRKNVANCVQYYYLSKKNENYKQLLKRQQKRRTRSFVRPAQQTPAITTNNTVSEDVTTNVVKDSTFKQEGNTTCCICGCDFSHTNQFRNVTRSNHHLYGIGVDALEPGLRICYSCRFRHVRHPSFDEPIEEEEDEPVSMDVDPTLTSTEDSVAADPTPDTAEPACATNGETNKSRPQRTCVRDIIYQAIEMSFQKPKTSEPQEVQVKTEPVQPPNLMAPLAVQHPPNIVPLEQPPPQPQPTPLTPHVPIPNIPMDPNQYLHIQQLQLEYNIRQQQILSQQLQQQQQLQRQQQMQRQQQIQRQQQLQQQQQIQQQQLHRQQQIISQQLQQQHQLQRQQQQQQQQQERAAAEQHIQQIARQQPPPQPMPPPQSIQKPLPSHPPASFQRLSPQRSFPPMAHGAQLSKSVPLENGVLNLSKPAISTPPMAQPQPSPPSRHSPLQLHHQHPGPISQPQLPTQLPSQLQLPMPSFPVMPNMTMPPLTIPPAQMPSQLSHGPQTLMPQSLVPPLSAPHTPTPISQPIQQLPRPQSQQLQPSNHQEMEQSRPLSQKQQPPKQLAQISPPPAQKTPVPVAPKSPIPPVRDEDSRSPNLTGSPTSPREMVIDESADVLSSPATSEQDDTTK